MIKPSYRTCVISREKKLKEELLRIVITKENKAVLDKTMKMPGRGFYISLDKNIIEKFLKSNYIKKRFKAEIDQNFIDTLNEYAKNEQKL